MSRECIQYSKVQGETKYFTRSVSDRHETKNETRQTTSFQLLFFQPLCRVGRLRFTHIEPTVDRDADSSSLTEHEPIFRDKRYSASTLSHNIEPRPSIVHFQRRKERKKKRKKHSNASVRTRNVYEATRDVRCSASRHKLNVN